MNHNEKRGNLVSYILDQISKNKTREEITQSLKDSGWTDEEINKGFLNIEEHKEKKRKKLWINLGATGFFIVFIVIILLVGPKSPVKIERTSQTIKPSVATGEIPAPPTFNQTAASRKDNANETRLPMLPPDVEQEIMNLEAERDARIAAETEEINRTMPPNIRRPPPRNASPNIGPPQIPAPPIPQT